jgi:pimeloyl-ACP methyl ester carboxylesterase
VVIVGHGEGGLRALVLAAQYGDDLAGVALLAAPGRPYADVLRSQAASRFAAAPPQVREKATHEHEAMLAAIAAGQTPPDLAEHATWLREIFEVRPDRLVAQVAAPLWLAQPDKDFEVDPHADLAALVAAAKRGKKRHEVARYADLDHLFKPEPGASSPARYLEDRRVDARFLADLVAWAGRVTRG